MAQPMYKRVLWTISFLIAAQFATGQVLPAKNTPWPVIKQQMRPWTRWWWMGNAVDEKNLGTALTTYQQAGIGGVEITPIYGAKGFESRYIKYLSPQWMQMLDFTVKKAHALNIGVDMNTGTGWPFGGPQITPEFAAAKLIIQQYKLTKGSQLAEAITVKDKKQQDAGAVLQAVTAYGANGATMDLLDKVDKNGKLNWTDQSSDWEIYAVFSGRTLQQVKRAAPGGEGYTLDHLDKPSVDTYLKTFDNAFAGHSPGVRAFFNDSYEVYGANWTPTFFKEFKTLKGYDLSKYIKELTGKDSTGVVTGRIKSDYRETMNQLLLDNFTKNWSDWAHRNKGISKNQSHGSPGNLLDLYAAVDIPETETFGSSYFPIPGLRRDSGDIRNVDPDPIMNKFASSAAHTKGKPFASSETLTWLTEHFKTSFSQAKPEAEQLFLAGINHIFYHGTTFTPADVPFPGWLFYASVNMVPANSLWPHLKGMNDYFSRCQSILQAGRSDNELLVYWPIYDQWANPKGMDMPMKVHDVDVWLHPTEFYKQSLALQGKGYSLDFASDLMLSGSKAVNGKLVTAPGATPYQTLIIPECRFMPVQTLESILSLAKAGATVIFQKLPEDVPGLADLDQKRAMFKQLISSLKLTTQTGGMQRAAIGTGEILVSNDLPQALLTKHIEGESLINSGLKFIRREVADGKYYYLVNHTAKTIDEWIPINAVGSSVLILDPQSGNYGQAQLKKENGKTWVKVNLESGEALFLQSANQKKTDKMWVYLTKPGAAVKLGATWNLHFTKGGPELPADQQLNKLVSWTATGDPKAESFSGTGEYTQTFVLPAKTAKEYVLSLGEVDESAHVWINGKDAGIIWSFPFRKRIGEYLVQGKNTIKIEVANLMANRMRYMDQKGIQWRNYHEINFVNINYKPFDASVWKVMPSGLLGPVEVKAYN